MPFNVPKFFHIDKRAELIIERLAGMPDEMLLSTSDTALVLDCSEQWLTIGRHRGYGPEYVAVTKNMVRYSIGGLRRFLEERVHRCTSEYTSRRLTDQHRANIKAGRARRCAEREAEAVKWAALSSASGLGGTALPSAPRPAAAQSSWLKREAPEGASSEIALATSPEGERGPGATAISQT